MNISNLLTVSAAVTIAVVGTIYGQIDKPVISYYAVTPTGCISYPNNAGCTTATTSRICTVFLDDYGTDCVIKRDNPATNPPTPCAITLYRP